MYTQWNWVKVLGVAILILIGIAACQSTSAPTSSPLETADTSEQIASQVPLTSATASTAPQIVSLADQSISDGERFPKLTLAEHVTDVDHDANQIEWKITGNEELELFFVGPSLYVTLPTDDWTGSEAIQFEACDPEGQCSAQEVIFTVRAENDPPVINVTGQVILPGEIFAEINLDDVVDDEESEAGELTWAIQSDGDLGISIDERIASVVPPSAEWVGQEMLRFEACDPEGICNAKAVPFWVMERTDTRCEVTYIGNAGFLITVGEKKLLIDALFLGQPISSDLAEMLETTQPPFDDVDLILATHIHRDHFHQNAVIRHMENNPGAMFVSSPDVVRSVDENSTLLGDRTIPIQIEPRVGEKTQLVVDEIGVEALFLDHGGGTLNLGYIITLDGCRLFHTGDMDPDSVSVSQLKRLGLPDKQIDIAFVSHFMLIVEEFQTHVTEGIQAKYIVPMHFQFTTPPPDYALMETYFPDAIVFRESLESWVMPGTSTP